MSSRIGFRLEVLPREALLALAAAGCSHHHELRNQADALLSQQCPLPRWCVTNVLLSRDLLPYLFGSLTLDHCAAAATCTAWATAWTKLLRQRRWLLPMPVRTLQPVVNGQLALTGASAISVFPNGHICVSCLGDDDEDELATEPPTTELRRVSRAGDILQERYWAETPPHSWVLVHEDAIYMSKLDTLGLVHKMQEDGTEVARSPPLRFPDGPALSSDGRLFVATLETVSVLDASTLELLFSFGCTGLSAVGCAIYGEELYVISRHGVEIFDLEGRHSRTLEFSFDAALACIAIHHDQILLVDSSDELEACILFITDMAGRLRHAIQLPCTEVRSILVRGNEVYLPDRSGIVQVLAWP